MKIVWSLFFLLIIVILACKPSKNATVSQATTSNDVSYIQGEWRLSSWQTKENTPFFEASKIPSIQIGDEKITGFGGCNRFSASIHIDNNKMEIGSVAATRMFCEGVPENEFFTILKGVNRFEITDKKLSIFDTENQNLIFKLVE